MRRRVGVPPENRQPLECERAYRLMPLYGASLVAVHMGLGGPTGGRTGGVPFFMYFGLWDSPGTSIKYERKHHMEKQYWVQREGKRTGPFSGQQLKQMAAAGMILTADMISTDQINWRVAGQVKGLFPGDQAADRRGSVAAGSRPEAVATCEDKLAPDSDRHVVHEPAAAARLPACSQGQNKRWLIIALAIPLVSGIGWGLAIALRRPADTNGGQSSTGISDDDQKPESGKDGVAGLPTSLEPDGEVTAHIDRGLAHSQKGEYDAAIRDFTLAIKMKADPTAYFARGNAYGEKKEFDLALKDYSMTIALRPDIPGGYVNRGGIYLDRKQFGEALKDFVVAVRLGPQDVKSRYGLARTHKAMRNVDLAIAAFTKVIELEPKHVYSFEARGMLYAGKGLHKQAMQDFSTLIQLFPKYPASYSYRAMCHQALGDGASAVRDWTRAIVLVPDGDMLYEGRAEAYYSLGQYDKAWADVKTCEKLGRTVDPDLRASIRKASGSNNTTASPKKADAEAHFYRGVECGSKGLNEDAAREFTKSIELNPGVSTVYLNRGLVRARMGEFNIAMSDFEQAIKLKPRDTSSYRFRAALHYRLRNYDKAWADVKTCQELGGTIHSKFLADLRKASGRNQ